jgi:hypothetical protein
VLTSLAPPRLGRLGGRFALQYLHARFFIAADHQTPVLVGVERRGIQLADAVGFGIKVLIVAVEPVRTRVRLAINVRKNTPDTRAADRVGVQCVE